MGAETTGAWSGAGRIVAAASRAGVVAASPWAAIFFDRSPAPARVSVGELAPVSDWAWVWAC